MPNVTRSCLFGHGVNNNRDYKHDDACLQKVPYDPIDLMKHNQQPETNQRQVEFSPHPPSPCSPAIRRTTIYQLTPASQDLMTPKTNLPVALEAMSNVWVPQDPRQRDMALPVIEGPRRAIRTGEPRQKQQYVAMMPPPRTGAKRANGVIKSCFSDSFLHTRVEPLDDGVNAGARPFRGLVPTSQDGRRPSTPIVESATKAGISGRRLRYFSSTDSPRSRNETEKSTPIGRSESPRKHPNRTMRGQKSHPKGDNRPKDSELRDAVNDMENDSFCIWKEKTRSLRRASQTSCKTEVEAPDAEDNEKITSKEEETKRKQEEFVIKHLNYCSSRKTSQVVKWLREVNLQDSFEIIE